MSEHTPTPWAVEEVRTSLGRCFKIGSPEMTETEGKPSYVCVYDDWGHGDNVQSANAAFIVKAVNSHDALVEALKSLTNEVRGVFDTFEYGIRQEISNTNFAVVCDKLEEAYRVLEMIKDPA